MSTSQGTYVRIEQTSEAIRVTSEAIRVTNENAERGGGGGGLGLELRTAGLDNPSTSQVWHIKMLIRQHDTCIFEVELISQPCSGDRLSCKV